MIDPTRRPSRVYCNRTLNFRSVKAIGYDMDYTLVDYNVGNWERLAFEKAKSRLLQLDWPVADLKFDPQSVIRGLAIDTQTGNIVKANRFGFVHKSVHGSMELSYEENKAVYGREIVDIGTPRWVILNTLFSISEACLYGLLVDMLDAHTLPQVMNYRDLYLHVRDVLDTIHAQGELKAEVIAHPEKYMRLDPALASTLLDQKLAQKKLLLITNSDWHYTQKMMSFALDPSLESLSREFGEIVPRTWRELFDVVVVSARKPDFFTFNAPVFEVASDEGLLRPSRSIASSDTVYFGGSAKQVEQYLGLSGDQIVYFGDHMSGDVEASKSVLRWRTGLILSELEDEVEATANFAKQQSELQKKMEQKQQIEAEIAQCKLEVARATHHLSQTSVADLEKQVQSLRAALGTLDATIAPLAKDASELGNPRWGLLLRAGGDKSLLARQLETFADIYATRVSHLETPYSYYRPMRVPLPHEIG